MKIQVGQTAPPFAAPDQTGQPHSLTKYQGQWLLLYFYPQDDTPGCTQEACAFRDLQSELTQYVKIIGVSSDTVESHREFAQKYSLNFPLLADPDKEIINAYGTSGFFFPSRTSFLISPTGTVVSIYEHVDPSHHAEEILTDIQKLVKTT